MKNTVSQQRGIYVFKVSRRVEGSCQVCSFDDAHRQVYVLEVGSMTLRLCYNHIAELTKKIRSA